jgi:glycosyltransferase involved in cell wall biosynthesis
VRIALTITELDPGGAEQCLVHLACYLKGRGHEVEVFALGATPHRTLGASPQREALTEQLDRAGVPWKCGPARGAASVLTATRWLQTELIRMQPEIIQSMLFHGNVVTALANRRLKKPHIGGARVSQTQWWRRQAQHWAVGKMRMLVCVSQQVADHCQQIEGIPRQKLVVIPNGIAERKNQDPSTRPTALQACLPSPQTPFLLFVGRLNQQKGIDALLQQLDAILEPLADYHFVLLGDGPMMQTLRDLIQASQCGPRVHLLGWQPAAHTWMPHARLLLLPSRYEGMPNVVLEAMQAGIPVVTFHVEGISELLGEDNLQVVTDGIPQFIRRIHQLSTDSTLARKLAQQNMQRVAENFRLEDQLAKYERLYQQHRMKDEG